MKVGDTVKIKGTDEVGIIMEKDSHDYRWVVKLAYTMQNHIFQQKDMELI
jgi:hypothetical protein